MAKTLVYQARPSLWLERQATPDRVVASLPGLPVLAAFSIIHKTGRVHGEKWASLPLPCVILNTNKRMRRKPGNEAYRVRMQK